MPIYQNSGSLDPISIESDWGPLPPGMVSLFSPAKAQGWAIRGPDDQWKPSSQALSDKCIHGRQWQSI